ncbi:YqiA/YcfP family alpha/beta fold hydrolase [Marinicella gelatinilytica]|uniref:YqiA/YcfP family alpha/beta fold hydrolase n=1 Tax=Marinicella gelatinilytica TaxID=2996017 RepID=UPI00226093BC|nr:YqiA/YcfP family alpha/beta fold hydrolase [Marinicella gelatinilytica]MCX7546237.1 alpha/beta hydrolase fold domain-containing protein [Marinicella gelatinilytica]
MHIIFSHGKESGPEGGKIRALAALATDLGCSYESVDYRDLPDHPDQRVERLVARISACDDDIILVGSSMGGYVSVAAACELAEKGKTIKQSVKGLFLMVPAVYLPGYERQDFSAELPKICIVHAWGDDIVPYENSLRLAQQHQADYHVFAGGHRLNEVLSELKHVFSGFLQGVV